MTTLIVEFEECFVEGRGPDKPDPFVRDGRAGMRFDRYAMIPLEKIEDQALIEKIRNFRDRLS